MPHREIAIKIAEKFKFEPHLVLAVAEDMDATKTRHDVSSCDNHLDQDFMDSLDRLEYLSQDYLQK